MFTKATEAAGNTSKTVKWVIASTLLGAVVALLVDPSVIQAMQTNPKLVAWIPITNILAVFLKKLLVDK